MKRLLFLCIIFSLLLPLIHAEVKYVKRYNKITKAWITTPEVSIHDIQFVPQDSLLRLDTLQISGNEYTLQYARRCMTPETSDDTVTITALCVVEPKVIGYTGNGFTMVLYDTGVTNSPWSGILVRCNAPTDTLQNIQDAFLSVGRGDIIKITGRLSEFPAAAVNSVTQFQPIPGITIDILNPIEKAPVPMPVMLGDSASKFYKGPFTTPYKVQYSTGEQYEGMLVELRSLTVTAYFNVGGRPQFGMVDNFTNEVATYDVSRWFTISGAWRDSTSTWIRPPEHSVIDTIRGLIMQVSGGGTNRGYFVSPIYQVNPLTGTSDVQFGVAKPTVFNHKRNPVFVQVEQSFTITAQLQQTAGGWPIDSGFIYMSQDYGPFEKFAMDADVDTGSTWGKTFLDLPVGTFVRYFIEAYDTGGQYSRLAYQKDAVTMGTDTSVAFFSFKVLAGEPTIADVQFTPYPALGVSPYVGASVTLRGIVTVDSSDMELTRHNYYNPNAYFIQSGNQPWSGIWLGAGTGDTSLAKTRRGDSISVTGVISEYNTATEIYPVINTVEILTTGNPVPEPVTLPTSTLASGSPLGEQYEGMLIRIVNATVTSLMPYYSDSTALMEINDGSGAIYMNFKDGKNSYTNKAADSLIGRTHSFLVGDNIDTLIGIAFYNSSANRWEICPRRDPDFVAGKHIIYDAGWNLISVGRVQAPAQTGYNVSTLFPGASSQAFRFANGYVPDTAIWPGVGYWLKVPSGKIYRQLGPKATLDTAFVANGWNLIGMIGDSIPTSSLVTEPVGTLSTFFGYKVNQGYFPATMLQPTRGYWVKTDFNGIIILSSGAFAKSTPVVSDLSKFNSLTIASENGSAQTLYFGTDAEGTINLANYEMPPTAPVGAIDARYVSGRALETYPSDLPASKQFDIALRNADGPVTVKWNIVNPDNKQFTLTNGTGKASIALAGSGETKMYKAPKAFSLHVMNGGGLPKEFAMSQNYPNPFNPTTRFMVALPVASHLEVGVFNILGQKVSTLVNESRDAGYYTITWNGQNDGGMSVASGVYFIKALAGDFTSVKKVVLVK